MKTTSLKKNAILSVVKQILRVAFPLITFPYVSRILLEDNLGKYNFTLSIISYFSIFAALGINAYAIREGARIRDDKQKLEAFASEIFTINLITTVLSYLALFSLYMCWPKLHGYTLLLFVQSLTIIAGTLGVDWINSIFEDFEYMTKRYIFVKCIALIAIFLFIKNESDYVLYAGINSCVEILASVMNIFYVRRYVHVKMTKRLRLCVHIKPMLILFANSLAIIVYTNADMTMLGIYKGDAEVGVYSVASKMYQIAKTLTNAVTIVMVPRLASLLGDNNRKRYDELIKKTIKTIATFMFPMIAGIFLLSDEIILFLGGVTFIYGSTSLKILSIALIPVCIGGIFFDGVLIVNRKEKLCFLITLLSASINILLNIFLIPWIGINGAAITTLVAELINCIASIIFSNKYYEKIHAMDFDGISVFVGVVCIIVSCVYLKKSLNGYIYSAVCICVCAVEYFAVLLFLKNSILRSLLDSFKRKVKKGDLS